VWASPHKGTTPLDVDQEATKVGEDILAWVKLLHTLLARNAFRNI
jgi:hypothetical protein